MISTGQVAASGSATSLCVVPPGPCTVILSNTGGATAYVGVAATGGTLTSSNGFPLPSGGYPVPLPGYAGAKGGTLSVVTAGTNSSTVGWIVSRT
jgi:hypothetical protein